MWRVECDLCVKDTGAAGGEGKEVISGGIREIKGDIMIKILGESSQEIGKNFEDFMVELLDHLGYCSFVTNIHNTGNQIDIWAENKVLGFPIYCECKAQQDSVNTNQLKKFYGQYKKEQQSYPNLYGLFFALSGFRGTAERWHSELDDEEKVKIKIYRSEVIKNLLQDSKMLVSEDVVVHELQRRLHGHFLGKRYIAYARRGPYWVQIIKDADDNEVACTVLDKDGKIPSKLICREIGKLDPALQNLTLFSLAIRGDLLKKLFDGKKRSLDKLARELDVSLKDIEIEIKRLKKENIINEQSAESEIKYYLRKDFSAFLRLAEEFLESDDQLEFMASNYCRNLIGQRVSEYAGDRFHVIFDKDEKIAVSRLLSVSPSALNWALFSDTSLYDKTQEHAESVKVSDEDRQRLEDFGKLKVLNKLQQLLIADLARSGLSDLLSQYGIFQYLIGIETQFHTQKETFFKMQTESPFALLKAAGPIEAGQLVSATDAGTVVNLATGLTRMGRFELALQEFDKAIEQAKKEGNTKALSAAYVNKGWTLAEMGQHEKAIRYYDKSIELDDSWKEAWLNKAISLRELGEVDEALRCLNQVLEKEPEYANAFYEKGLIHLLGKNILGAKEAFRKAITLSPQIVNRLKEDPRFGGFRKERWFQELLREGSH